MLDYKETTSKKSILITEVSSLQRVKCVVYITVAIADVSSSFVRCPTSICEALYMYILQKIQANNIIVLALGWPRLLHCNKLAYKRITSLRGACSFHLLLECSARAFQSACGTEAAPC